MVKKRVSSSSVTDKKPGTPKVSFKKTISPSKNAKKKQLTPFNKLIIKKSIKSKKPGWSSQGNIVEDENPREVSKEKKKKTLSKDKETKTEITRQEKNRIKPLKKWSSFDEQTKIRVNKNGGGELVSGESPKKKKPVKTKEVPKIVTKKKKEGNIKDIPIKQSSKVEGLSPKLKPDKLVKKTPVKVSSSLGKTAKKTTKKPVKTIPQKYTKSRKKETGVPEDLVGKIKMSSTGGRKTRKSSSDPKVPSEISSNTPLIQIKHLDDSGTEPGPTDKTENLEKVNENYPAPDSLVMSSPPEELSEPIAQEPRPSSGIIDETHSESCSQESKVNENYPAPDSLVMSSPPEELSEPIVYGQGGEDEHSLGTNSEAGSQLPDGAEDISPPLSPSLSTFNFTYLKSKWDEFLAMENAACNIGEDMVLTKSIDKEVKELDESEPQDSEDMVLTKSIDKEVKELDESEPQDNEAASNGVTEENTEHNTSKIEGEDNVTKINLKEEEDKDLVETDSQANQNSIMKKSDEQEDKMVELDSQGNKVLPEGDGFGMFISPERENSSPQKSTVEDDLCLSTSVSQSSSRSSVSSGSVDELYKLNKTTKSKKNLDGPLSSKLPLKREKEVASIGDIKRKRKRLDSIDSSFSPNIFSEPADHSRTFEDCNSPISPQYHYRELQNSRTSESSSGLSPLKVMKVVVKRLEEDNLSKNRILIGRVPDINKGPRIALKEAPVLSEKSVVGKQKPLLRTEIQTCKSHAIMDRASSMHTDTNKLNFEQEFLLDPNIKLTLSHEDSLTQRFLQDYNINNIKENKVIDHIYYMGFYVNNNSTDLHFLPEDCSVSLTKIDCEMNDMEKVSPTTSSKYSTTRSISCSQTNEIDFQVEKPRVSEKNVQHQILSKKHNTSFTKTFSNISSAKDGSRALNSSEFSPQGSGKTYSRIVNKQKASAKYSSNTENLPDNSLKREENKSSPGTNNRSKENDSLTSSLSGFSLQRTPVSTAGEKLNSEVPEKKPKLCKTDLNLKRKQFLKIICNDKSKHALNYVSSETKKPASPAVDSRDRSPNNTIQQMGKLLIPIRKIINTNIAKSESSAEPYFKQPQVHNVGKVRNIITFENNEISRNKPSLSTGNSNVNAIPNVTPVTTIKTYHQNKNYCKTPADYSVTLTDTLAQSNRNSEEDDTFSILSVDLHPALRNFVEDVIEPDVSRTCNFLRGNPDKQSSIYLENVSIKPCKATQETTYEKRYTYNGYDNESHKQGNDVCQLRTYTKEGSSKCFQNQLVNSNKLHDDDQDEDGEDELINKKRVMIRNTAVEYRKHMNDFRCGTSLKSVAEDQTVFPPSRSRSNSSLSGSNNFYGSDNISYENLLHGTPFDGYCLFYLRNSVPKNQEHQCDLKHEVPDVLFNLTENDESKRSTSKGINHVCKEHCNNPPLRLLDGITMFCIKNKQKQELSNVISFLKNSITADKVGLEKYKEIWTVFTKTLVKYIVQFDKQPTLAINCFLQTIFDEGGQIRVANQSILYDVLGDLAKLANKPSLRLMHCIQFLKDMRFPVNVNSYPISFIEAVLHQVLEKAKVLDNPRQINDKNPNSNVHSFVYLVYKTFFDNINDCRFLYKESRFLSEKFLNIATILGEKVKAKLNQLEIENGSVREPIDPWGLNIRQTNTEHMIRRLDNTVVPQQHRSNFMGVNNFPNTLTSQAVKEMAPKEVFDLFKSKSALIYLEVLQKCEDYVKRKHADVTMSFLLLESEKENSWNHCYSLFQELIEFNPHIVKDFTNKNNTPARRLLVIIFCCLNSNHIQDAVDLFLRFGLYEADHSKWLVDKSPEDEAFWKIVCENLETAFCNLSQFTDTEAKLFITIIHHQKSLREPVYLQTGLNNFFRKAANLCAEGCWNAMATIVSAIVEENLLKQLNLEGVELYRILVRAVCAADNMPDSDAPAICARLMRKSNKVCDIYPKTWAKDCHELTIKTCLTVEELYAFFTFKIKAFKKLLELKSLHITFEEPNINPKNWWKQPYFRDVDSSIKGAIERFKIACRRIGLEPTSLIIHNNKITVDKVILQGTL